ncbi:efflux RND transporter periplasmic adaptor subunit [Pelagicoccus sp. SDUM812003]|uniref:efflux RND transporter periplasmic adaptor subunit n=1 Tax=Pelagicoccus sp. SDUM812003 TaxID=3041267 RepID=UPI00280D3167|nr:efflux RND transporter periplasmic adaptor subunit [Pelagicoccus sp. SDUM812003]MDQ8205177.1 efflux RND transporter periplasmic adaptor subunit [Pelagicoccus sp. SDUM812003]
MKTGLLVKIFVALAVIAGGSIYFVSSLKPTAVVSTARRSVAVRSVPGTVQVVAAKEMFVRNELGGRVVESRLDLGKEVAEGDLLVAMDLGDLEIGIEKVKIEIEAAKLSVEQGSTKQFDLVSAQERLTEAKRRFDIGGASQSELDRREREIQGIEQAIDAEMSAKEVRLAQLENELKLLERNREKMFIRAPIDGVISEVYAFRGDLLRGGEQIARLISLDRIVEVRVSEENFAGVEVGQIARVKFLGYSDQTFDGTVSKTLPVADPETQRYTVHLDLDIDRERLFPGLTGEATITLDEREDALIIPGSAILGDRVFLVEDGVVEMREIEKGFGSMTNVEIRSGLEAGDQVIVEELELFKVGDKVKTEEKTF